MYRDVRSINKEVNRKNKRGRSTQACGMDCEYCRDNRTFTNRKRMARSEVTD